MSQKNVNFWWFFSISLISILNVFRYFYKFTKSIINQNCSKMLNFAIFEYQTCVWESNKIKKHIILCSIYFCIIVILMQNREKIWIFDNSTKSILHNYQWNLFFECSIIFINHVNIVFIIVILMGMSQQQELAFVIDSI